MWTTEIIQGISGGILAIVGILLAISGGNLWGREPKWSIALGISLFGVGLFILLTSFPEYAIGFSVLATLALAFAAFLTIKEADAREKRRRNEVLLDDIIQWAENLLAIISKYPSVYFENLEELLVRAHVLLAQRYSVVIKTGYFDKENLKTLAQNSIEEFKKFLEQADSQAIGMGRKQRVETPANLKETLEELIRKVANLRTAQ